MLRKLLQHLGNHGLCQVREIAHHLDVSEALVRAMLAELELRGYMKSSQVGIDRHCQACPMRMGCTVRQTRLWSLTVKGAELARLQSMPGDEAHSGQ